MTSHSEAHNVLSSHKADNTVEATGWRKLTRKPMAVVGLIAAGVTVAGAATFGGVEIANAGHQGHTTSQGGEANGGHDSGSHNNGGGTGTETQPSDTPTPQETSPSNVPNFTSAMQTEIDNDEESANFASLPKPKQLSFAYDLMQKYDINAYETRYASVSGDSDDAVPGTATLNDDPQKIITTDAMNKRFLGALSGQEREDYIIAVLKDGKSSTQYAELEKISKAVPNTVSGGVFAVTKILYMETPAHSDPLVNDGPGNQYRTITDSDGNTANYYFYEVDTADGGTFATWIHE